jgi:hypothetical protein
VNLTLRVERLEHDEQATASAVADPQGEAWWAGRKAAWAAILDTLPDVYAVPVARELWSGATLSVHGRPSALARRVDRMATRLQYMTDGTWARPGDPMSGSPYHGPQTIPPAVCALLTTLAPDEAAAVLFSVPICPRCGLELPTPSSAVERHPEWRAAPLPPERFYYVTECPHCGVDLLPFEQACLARRRGGRLA